MSSPITAAQILADTPFELIESGNSASPDSATAVLAAIAVAGLAQDSREVVPGSIFFALPGERFDGSEFIARAAAAGAVLAVASRKAEATVRAMAPNIPVALVKDPRAAVSSAADIFYGTSRFETELVGVTGTNGKTSVAWIISEALAFLGEPSGYSGTLGRRILDRSGNELSFESAKHTTPEAIELHAGIATARACGVRRMAIEVSSHGIAQRRIDHLKFAAAVFTNLTRDHLDFHNTLEAYFETKMQLFTGIGRDGRPPHYAVINVDDECGRTIPARLQGLDVEILRQSRLDRSGPVEIKALSYRTTRLGIELNAELLGRRAEIRSSLVGDYNVMNLLSAAGALAALGFSAEDISHGLGQVRPVPGRLELAKLTEPAVYVDYAHTPDGLVNALGSIRLLRQSDPIEKRGRIITVFGCGGDRDRGKRPLMGRAAAELSDLVVVTSDNPRSEAPDAIIADIMPGISGTGAEVIPDRRQAICRAIELARPEDIVLVAGKGHETYQEISGVRQPFSDIEICREKLARRG